MAAEFRIDVLAARRDAAQCAILLRAMWYSALLRGLTLACRGSANRRREPGDGGPSGFGAGLHASGLPVMVATGATMVEGAS